ncbi:MAG: hypothetical protein AB9879_09950 [Methanothrix sp.]
MFVLGNYTIDTGAYGTPYDAGISTSGALQWSWNNKEKTCITVSIHPMDDSNISKLSDDEYMALFIQTGLVGTIEAIDAMVDTSSKDPDFNNSEELWKKLSPIVVEKPYPGCMAISSNHPEFKVYVGAINKFDYVTIVSTEEDEMMALIMSELKIYPKEESNAARLQAIQKRL